MKRLSLLLLSALLAMGLVLSGCSSGSDDSGAAVVTPVAATGVTVAAAGSATSVKTSGTLVVSATVVPANTTETVSWTATSTDGTVSFSTTTGTTTTITGTKAGSVTITATVGSFSDDVTISVVDACAIPTVDIAAGTYTSAQTVALSTTTSGADIYYTTDGTTTPTSASTKYVSAIAVSSTMTIKAIAIKTGSTDSDVASFTYYVANSAHIGFEADTASYFQGSTLSAEGTDGFFTVDGTMGNTGAAMAVDVTNNGVYSATNLNSATTWPAIPWEGARAIHLLVTTGAVGSTNYAPAYIGVAKTKMPYLGDGTSSGLLGNLSGGSYTGTSTLYIDNSDKTVTYKFAIFVPTGSVISSVGLLLGDGSTLSRIPCQPLVAGVWNYLAISVLGGNSTTNAATTLTASSTVTFYNGGTLVNTSGTSASVSAKMICTSVTNSANPSGSVVLGRHAGSQITNPAQVRFIEFVFGSSTLASSADVFIDDISWE